MNYTILAAELLMPFCLFFFRAYLDVKELKEILHLDGSTHLNVFFANSSDEDLAGVATWPWDKEALTHLGRGQKKQKTTTYMHAHTRSCAHIFCFVAKVVGRRQCIV